MNRVFAWLGRFAVILAGYVAAALAASAFLNLVFLGSAGFSAEQAPMVATGSIVFSIPFVALFVAYFAFIPSIPVILVAEILGRRDWLSYAIGGAVIGLAVVGFFFAIIGGGMVGGIAYWLIAGRWAGSWLGPAGSAGTSDV